MDHIIFEIKFRITGMNWQKCNSIFKNQAFTYAIEGHTKGQLISECPMVSSNLLKETIEIFSRIPALALKKRLNKKNKGTLYR